MKLQSYTITQGKDRAAARSQLKAIGFTDEDLKKPIIGIANTWIGTMPCNFKLRDLAVQVADGVRKAGGTPMEYNTIAISDGITMGTEGMKASLVSRDLPRSGRLRRPVHRQHHGDRDGTDRPLAYEHRRGAASG